MKTLEETLETNKKQRDFYNDIRQNFATQLWASIRNGLLNRTRKNIGVQEQVYATHKIWFGDLASKKVLDLGCFSGNYLSLYLAEHAMSYTGIDLSDIAIAKLQQRISHLERAKAVAVDFLSDEFVEADFDLIYAYGVLHHFPNNDVLMARLNEKLADSGEIISYDPLQTSLPIRIMRLLYRPFQSDAAWEWPFTERTVKAYRDNFELLELHGLLGKAKWSALLNLLPLSYQYRSAKGKEWHDVDWKESAVSDRSLFRCMHLTMRLRKKAAVL